MKPRFISDLHLSEKHPELTQAFFKFLNESKEACTHLFILGDLFETWIGDDDNSSLHSEIKTALKSFTTNGPETFFIHGNRDFLVGEVFAKETGVTILPDPYTLEINGQKVILSHGDFLCTDDKDYIEFRNQVRDQNWQNSFLKKSLTIMLTPYNQPIVLLVLSASLNGGVMLIYSLLLLWTNNRVLKGIRRQTSAINIYHARS